MCFLKGEFEPGPGPFLRSRPTHLGVWRLSHTVGEGEGEWIVDIGAGADIDDAIVDIDVAIADIDVAIVDIDAIADIDIAIADIDVAIVDIDPIADIDVPIADIDSGANVVASSDIDAIVDIDAYKANALHRRRHKACGGEWRRTQWDSKVFFILGLIDSEEMVLTGWIFKIYWMLLFEKHIDVHLNHFNWLHPLNWNWIVNVIAGDANSYWDEACLPPRAGT